jgi:hypothetical protein
MAAHRIFHFSKDTSQKRIFTFWEPKENVPAYLTPCMKTWANFLPEYEVAVLDQL